MLQMRFSGQRAVQVSAVVNWVTLEVVGLVSNIRRLLPWIHNVLYARRFSGQWDGCVMRIRLASKCSLLND